MDPFSIILFLFLFLLSAFFSGSEIGLMSIPYHKIDSFIKQRKSGAKSLKLLRSNSDRLLITILIGNNLVNVVTASLATKISIDIATASGIEQSLAIGISAGIITLLLLLFGEIFPKILATRYADTIALSVAKIYLILGKILYPIVISVEYLMKIFQKQQKKHHTITDEEIESFIEMSNKSGVFEQGEYEKIKNMLDFYDVTAQEIMTPRVKIDAISDICTVEEAKRQLIEFSHSRIPVYHGTIDHIDHVVRLKELLVAEQQGLGNTQLKDIHLSDILKVPLTKPIHLVLDMFKKTRNHIALVIDEYGGVAGLLTLEDIVEEVFGEILDETDREILSIKQEGNGYLFQSYITMDEFLDHLGLSFFDISLSEEEFSGETLSYFITSYLERFPKIGECIKLPLVIDAGERKKYLRIKIISLEKNTIGQVKSEIVYK